MGPVARELEHRITAALQPTALEIIDESEGHRGHGGHNEAGESHIRVRISAPGFEGMSRVNRVRAVQRAAGDLVTGGRIHAFTVEIL